MRQVKAIHYKDLPKKLETPYVSLTTDFGLKDESVGSVKAVIRNICPEAIIDDYNHGVKAYDVREGAWSLWATFGYAPIGSHLAVVDPGVGTERKPLAIQVRRFRNTDEPYEEPDYLIGPDNGLLIPATRRGKIEEIVTIDEDKVGIKPISPIFHGRDIFAPTAALLALDGNIAEIAKEKLRLEDLVPAPYAEARRENEKLIGEVLRHDLYGNIFTTIPLEWAEQLIGYGNEARVSIAGREEFISLHPTFASVDTEKYVLTDNAYGELQIAVNLGSAAEKLGIDSDTIHSVIVEKKSENMKLS